jgi:hypothetical protein
MTGIRKFVVLVSIGLLIGCAPEPEGDVAINVTSSFGPSKGQIEFDISETFLDARTRSGFDIVVLVVPRDAQGAIKCTVQSSASSAEKSWFDSSGNKWVRLGRTTRIEYTRDRGSLSIDVDGVAMARCDPRGQDDLTLGVLFDARPRPSGWSGEGMHGFSVSIP